jgi:hypothetical protein
MRRKSDEYFDKIKGAVPVTEEEDWNFEKGMEAREREELADTVAKQVTDALVERLGAPVQKKVAGAPRKTEGDVKLLEELSNKHRGDMKHAKKEFLDIICEQFGIKNKRANERYRAAWKVLGNRNT